MKHLIAHIRSKHALWFFGCIALILVVPLPAEANWLYNTAGELFFEICVRLGGLVLMLGSLLLDTTVWYLVVTMGEWFRNNAGLGNAMELGWTIVRDLLNMCFIFALIVIGIKTILNSEDSGTRKALGYLLAAALLINFSLFITKTVIDFSNVMATQVYTVLVDDKPFIDKENPDQAVWTPIANNFLSAVKLTSFLEPSGLDPKNFKANIFLFSILLFFFFVMAGISFILGAFLILSRFVALVMYMIFSPVMFMGWILPKFKGWADKWWEGFFKQCFFAPAYLFLLYISLQILRGLMAAADFNIEGTSAGFATAFDAQKKLGVDWAQLIMFFLIMIGLLWASLKIGDQMSIAGGKATVGGFNRAGGRLSAGLAGYGLRGTVGRGANMYANSEFGQRAAMNSAIGRRMMLGADATRQASFDARNTKAAKDAGLGSGQKGGFVQKGKDIEKQQKKLAKLVSSGEHSQVYANAGLGDFHETQQQYQKDRKANMRKLAITIDPKKRAALKKQIKNSDEFNKGLLDSKFGADYTKLKGNMKKEIQNEFADKVAKRGILPNNKKAYKKAAESIRTEINKDPNVKAQEDILEALKKLDKDD